MKAVPGPYLNFAKSLLSIFASITARYIVFFLIEDSLIPQATFSDLYSVFREVFVQKGLPELDPDI